MPVAFLVVLSLDLGHLLMCMLLLNIQRGTSVDFKSSCTVFSLVLCLLYLFRLQAQSLQVRSKTFSPALQSGHPLHAARCSNRKLSPFISCISGTLFFTSDIQGLKLLFHMFCLDFFFVCLFYFR